MLVVPEVPYVLTAPGTYKVSAEKSRPFKGKFEIVFAVNKLPSEASFVFKIGEAAVTSTVVEPPPTSSFTLKFAVCKTSS